MRSWTVCFFLVLCSVAGLARANHRVALVIGSSQYSGKDAIPEVARDAQSVADLLEERQFRVTTALDRPRDELRALLQGFIGSIPVNGTALIYFGGHSMTVKDNQGVFQGLLLTVDGNRKAIVLGELVEEVGTSSAAKSIVILIDSGQGLPAGIRRTPRPARTQCLRGAAGRRVVEFCHGTKHLGSSAGSHGQTACRIK